MVENRQPVLRQRNATVLPVTVSTFLVSCILGGILLVNLLSSSDNTPLDTTAITPIAATQTTTFEVPATPVVTEWQTYALVNGDNLSHFLLSHHATRTDIKAIMSVPAVRHNVRRLPAGESVEVKLNDQSQLVGIKLPLKQGETLTLSRTDTGFSSNLHMLPIDTKNSTASGRVGFSLAASMRHAGLPSRFADELSQIFAWKLNLAHDLNRSSTFNIVYQVQEQDGKKIGVGHILAAEITTHGKTYTAIGFTNNKEQIHYYTPDGQSLEGGFLRAPLHYLRVSSPFSLSRMQPILHIRRPHEGVDLAAPSGTAVHTVGDGVVEFVGRDAGYGNLVIIDHGHGLATRYAHLARFAAHLHRGDRVSEGDTIGFVGSTGLATGPHLHYELRINGRPVNPLTASLPNNGGIYGPYRREFFAQTKVLEKELNGISTSQLA